MYDVECTIQNIEVDVDVDPNADAEPVNPIGILLVVISQLFAGGLYIVEEKLLGDYYLDPLKVVGLEGLWGLLMTLIILPIFQ